MVVALGSGLLPLASTGRGQGLLVLGRVLSGVKGSGSTQHGLGAPRSPLGAWSAAGSLARTRGPAESESPHLCLMSPCSDWTTQDPRLPVAVRSGGGPIPCIVKRRRSWGRTSSSLPSTQTSLSPHSLRLEAPLPSELTLSQPRRSLRGAVGQKLKTQAGPRGRQSPEASQGTDSYTGQPHGTDFPHIPPAARAFLGHGLSER